MRLGKLLHEHAKSGRLPGVTKVEGAPEIPGQRSADYRFTLDDGRVVSADLYQPESTNVRSITAHIMQKSGQATVVIVELGRGHSSQIEAEETTQIAQMVIETPGHTIHRILVIKDNRVRADRLRAI